MSFEETIGNGFGEPEYDGEGGGDGGSDMSQEEWLYRFRFRIPSPDKNPVKAGSSVKKRVLFLQGEPRCVYEHDTYKYRKHTRLQAALCLRKHKVGNRGCPFCEDNNNYAPYVGFFVVIDMGQLVRKEGGGIYLHHNSWKKKDGEEVEERFPKRLLVAKHGSDDKPGVLRKLREREEERGGPGSLTGTVWDVTRSGSKEASVGEDWQYVERIDPDQVVGYLQECGANPDELDVAHVDIAKVLKANLVSYEQMATIVGGGGGQRAQGAGYGGGNGGSGGSAGMYDGPMPPDDDSDNIPF